MTIEIEDRYSVVHGVDGDAEAADASQPGQEAPEAQEEAPLELLQVAIHVLDPRGRGLLLTDECLELSPPVRELFSSYVQAGVGSDALRFARFRPESAARPHIDTALSGGAGFLAASRELAGILYTAMEPRRTASADLAIVLATDGDTGSAVLGILKLDLQRLFRREVVESHGRTRIRLVPVDNLMPETDRRLQKCAFIPQTPHTYPYDLVVVDNQAPVRDGTRSAAAYFGGDFLGCEVIDGPRELTQRLPRETERWLQEEGISPTVAIQARESVIHALREPEVDLDSLAGVILGDDPADAARRERYREHLQSSGMWMNQFTPDSRVADRLSSTLTYILDNGVKISGDAEAVAELLQIDPEPTEDGMVHIVIYSTRFERKY